MPPGRSVGGTGHETDAEVLARYDPHAFPCFAVTVDVNLVTIHQGRLSILLVERAVHPYRAAWALPGGFVGADEDLPDAAWRMLARETGLRMLPDGIHLEQLGTYGRPNRDPRTRVVSVAYLALTPDISLPDACVSSSRVRFWPVKDLDGDDAPPLAFDHAHIVHDAVERARAKLQYTTVALAFLEEPLTLADLRHVYETVWGVTLDPSNFRRKVLDTPGFVVPLGGEVRREHGVGRGRPGELYRKGTAFWLERVIARPRPAVAEGSVREGLQAERRTTAGRDDDAQQRKERRQ